MEEVKKKDILLNLADLDDTARVCRALSSETRLEILKCLIDRAMTISELAEKFYLPMSSMCLHIKTLREANLISVVPKPGIRGSQKLCGMKTTSVTLDLFAHVNKRTGKPPAYIYMPIGHYSNCEVCPPCGIASATSYLHYEDSPYGFYFSDHIDAAIIWFTKGFLEYQFPNFSLQQGKVSQIEFTFEICSEAPGYNNNWPSNITLEINHNPVVTFLTKGDYGGRKGSCNPDWWSDSNSQFGEFKRFTITDQGSFLDGEKVSEETIESLKMKEGYHFSFILKVDENRSHVGGMNLFGKHFGDHPQDIIMKVDYAAG